MSAGRMLQMQALVPMLAPDNSWVIQGRCCGMLTLLIRHELRMHVSRAEGERALPSPLTARPIMQGTVEAAHGRITCQRPLCTAHATEQGAL